MTFIFMYNPFQAVVKRTAPYYNCSINIPAPGLKDTVPEYLPVKKHRIIRTDLEITAVNVLYFLE